MAKVKIQGHASGTGVLTVTAPNTSTDRTITLPDSTGTLLTADGDGSSLTGITSGATSINGLSDATVTATNNIGLGSGAVDSITTGDNNVGIGVNALTAVTDGNLNVAVGTSALTANTSGDYNVAVGIDSLTANTTGGYSTAVGYQALATTTTGNHNVAVGRYSLKSATTANDNTAVGKNSAYSTTTGYSNVAIGSNTLESNTTGHNHTAVGQGAMNTLTTGTHNTAFGATAMLNATTSGANVAVGSRAMESNTTGSSNTAAGYKAMRTVTTGAYNVGVGREALESITTGSHNVCVGHGAGNHNISITTGTNNVCIGSYTRPGASDGSNQIMIGYDVQGSTANQVHIGSNAGKIYNSFASNASWTQSSDQRLKKNIQTNTLGLDFINDLRPVTYNWKKSTELDSTDPHMVNHYDAETNHKDDTTTFHGFIAQEVKAALDTAGVDNHGAWDLQDDGVQGVSIEAMVTPLVKAVQELSAKVKALEEA